MTDLICVACGKPVPRRFLHTSTFRPFKMFQDGEIWRDTQTSHFIVSVYDKYGNDITTKATCKSLEYNEDPDIARVLLSGKREGGKMSFSSVWVITEVGGPTYKEEIIRQTDERKRADALFIAKGWIEEHHKEGYQIREVTGSEWELTHASLNNLTIRITEWDFV